MQSISKVQLQRSLGIFSVIIFFICLYGIFYSDTRSSILSKLVNRRIPIITKISTDYFHVELDFTSNTAICQTNDYLIIYILSTAQNIERRNVIRSTWASKRTGVCFVFILGQVVDSPLDTQMKINEEKKLHQDIVQINHNESYANVVYKEVATLQWSQYFYPSIPYLFKTDDDLIVDAILAASIAHLLITNVTSDDSVIAKYRLELISDIQSSNRTSFFRGWSTDSQPTVRGDPKFGVSEEVWPYPTLPLYCSGFGWLMSNYVRDQLVNASLTYPPNKIIWIGDVFVSGFVAKEANVKCTGMPVDYEQTASANCSCLMKDNPMIIVCSSSFHAGGGGTELEIYNEYRRAWRVIQLRHNSTKFTNVDC